VPLSTAAAVGNRAQAALAELLLWPLAPLVPIEPAPEAVNDHVLVTVVVLSPLRHASIIGTALMGVDVRRTGAPSGGRSSGSPEAVRSCQFGRAGESWSMPKRWLLDSGEPPKNWSCFHGCLIARLGQVMQLACESAGEVGSDKPAPTVG
jgi:hypothetical protein